MTDASCGGSTLANSTATTVNYDRSISIARTGNWRRKSIQALIDDEIQNYNDWKAELFLDVVLDGDIIPTRVNIMDHIGAKGSLHQLRFCRKKYKVDGMFKGRGWEDLKRDICRSAYDCGYQLSSNGPYGKQLNLRQFVCGYGRVCQTRNEPNSELCSIVHKQDVEMNRRKICN